MVEPFPVPPAAVRDTLHQLTVLRSGDQNRLATLAAIPDLPRPWDPGSCDPQLRVLLWRWCDEVAAWVNATYAWRPADMIPACWPAHPHLAVELPLLACTRYAAGLAYSPDALEDWHRYTLPMFLDRLAHRLGEGTCRTGRHSDWPAESRHAAFADAAPDRERVFTRDTPPDQLRGTGR